MHSSPRSEARGMRNERNISQADLARLLIYHGAVNPQPTREPDQIREGGKCGAGAEGSGRYLALTLLFCEQKGAPDNFVSTTKKNIGPHAAAPRNASGAR